MQVRITSCASSVLHLCSGEDNLVPSAEEASRLKAAMASAKVTVREFQDSGHTLLLVSPHPLGSEGNGASIAQTRNPQSYSFHPRCSACTVFCSPGPRVPFVGIPYTPIMNPTSCSDCIISRPRGLHSWSTPQTQVLLSLGLVPWRLFAVLISKHHPCSGAGGGLGRGERDQGRSHVPADEQRTRTPWWTASPCPRRRKSDTSQDGRGRVSPLLFPLFWSRRGQA